MTLKMEYFAGNPMISEYELGLLSYRIAMFRHAPPTAFVIFYPHADYVKQEPGGIGHRITMDMPKNWIMV